MKLATTLASVLLGSSICVTPTNGFAVVPAAATTRTIKGRTNAPGLTHQPWNAPITSLPSSSSSALSMIPTDISLDSVNTALMTGSILSSSISSSSTLLTSKDSSLIQAEFLNGMVHALLDFTSLFGAATIVIRLSAVLGRVLVMAQDVSPGHELLPDELAFQTVMLLVACHALHQSVMPKIHAHWWSATRSPFLTSQDRLAYRRLFKPAGISWHQYKELYLASMDWITVEPGHVILSEEEREHDAEDDAVYWLYKGDAHVSSNDKLLHVVSGETHKTNQEVAGLGLLGETKLAKLLDDALSGKKKRKPAAVSEISSNEETASSTRKSNKKITAVAGDSGATLLRMNTTKLEKLLKHDQELTYSVGRLAFKGMQDKLDALMVLNASN